MIRRPRYLALAVVAGFLIASTLSPGPAWAAPYDDYDPIATGCANSVTTAREATITVQSGPYTGKGVGTIQLRYSTQCRTVWARIILWYGSSGLGGVHRNSDGRTIYCDSMTRDSASLQYFCYSRMLNDANVTSYAYGQTYYDLWYAEGRTANY